MTLDQWVAFHGAVQASRLEDLAGQIAATHAANPKRSHEQLIRAARQAEGAAGRRNLLDDPERMKRLFQGFRGVEVTEAEPKDGDPR